MIRPGDAGNEARRHPTYRGEGRVRAERSHRLAHERARAEHAHERHEVAAIGKDEPERRRINLASRLARIKADGLERIHRDDPLVALSERARIVEAAHGLGPEIGRLFVDEKRKADALAGAAVEIA